MPIMSASNREATSSPELSGASQPHVWAIASGKGGVGKSVFSTNFAASLAARGQTCALLDLDLGCANLHTMLGVTKGRGGLNRVIDRKVESLADALTPTGIEGLCMLAGDRASPGTANLSYARKQRILRQIENLPVDHVVMDLGAGTALNVLDFFLAADTGVVVVVPEPTSIENTYDFLLAAFLRSLRAVSREEKVREALDGAIAAHNGQIPGPRDLLAAVKKQSAEAGLALSRCFDRFSAQLVVNRIRNARHHELGPQIVQDAATHLGATLQYTGAITADDCVINAVIHGRPVIERFPGSQFAHDFDLVVGQLLQPKEATAAPLGVSEGPAPSASVRATSGEIAAPVAEAGEANIDLSSPGRTLQRRREQLGLSLEECLGRTRIRCLAAIEAEDFEKLPPELYLRSFVAQYAMLLGLDQAAGIATAFVTLAQGERPAAATASASAEAPASPGGSAPRAGP